MGYAVNYVVICNWERFQHYKDRNPPWIKNYVELLSDDAYLGLSGHRRAILHGLWMEYARSRSRIPHDTRTLTRRLDLKVTTADLAALNHAGFIAESASTVQAEVVTKRYPSRAPAHSQEAEAEKEKEQTPSFLPAEANGDTPDGRTDDIDEQDLTNNRRRLAALLQIAEPDDIETA